MTSRFGEFSKTCQDFTDTNILFFTFKLYFLCKNNESSPNQQLRFRRFLNLPVVLSSSLFGTRFDCK